ncbi:ParB/RepB/Spo0J family partition protein [Anaerobaca lacustris]|uniref:ParB/RepB/Spo0J family partition protein n=1 Tax=Anaerobaca lacustris TaxID=3044600 RepID=A0AAW6U2H7_9BACT|nr:ParB/RepB/Spo0J family partition protein [Sedimentisphaerales bacterium M17dextr]
MTMKIRKIELSRLWPHPDHANRMSRAAFGKLMRHIKRTGYYEPLVVRPHPHKRGSFQILHGHHRCEALRRLGHETAQAVVWNVDDEQADILLATLNRLAGAIVYCMPNPRVEMRRIATAGLFAGLDRQSQLALLNRNVRCIARLAIEPPFRGIGLATRLVRETLGRVEVPLVEAMAVCGAVHPFFERAGMQPFTPRASVEHATLLEALSAVGIDARANGDSPLPIDPQALQQRIDTLPSVEAAFLERAIQGVLKSHGTRRTMPSGLERTRYLLTRLTQRPMYYLWRHPTLEVTWP